MVNKTTNKRVLVAHSDLAVSTSLFRVVSERYLPLPAQSLDDIAVYLSRDETKPAISILPDLGIDQKEIGTVIDKISEADRHIQVILVGNEKQESRFLAADLGAYCYLDIGASPESINPSHLQRVLDGAWFKYDSLAGRNADRRTLCHDANNAAGVLTGYVGMMRLLHPNLPEDVKGFLATMDESGKKLTDLLGQIQGTLVRGSATELVFEYPVNELVFEHELSGDKKRYVVLHVDDEPAQRDLFARGLTKFSNIDPGQAGYFGHDTDKVSYEVYSADSVRDAILKLELLKDEKKSVDLIVSDREMPEINGFQFFEMICQGNGTLKMRDGYSHVKRLAMLSGGASPDEIRQASLYGSFAKKPLPTASIEPWVYKTITQQPKQ